MHRIAALIVLACSLALSTGAASASASAPAWSCALTLEDASFVSGGSGTAQCVRGSEIATSWISLTISSWSGDRDDCENASPWHASGWVNVPSISLSASVTLDGHAGDAEAVMRLSNGQTGVLALQPDNSYLAKCVFKNPYATIRGGFA